MGALAWNSDILSSGSRDRLIMQRDTRTPPQTCDRRLEGHRQEVCGLKWSPGMSKLYFPFYFDPILILIYFCLFFL